MADQPGLALIVMLTLGVAAGLFISVLWPMGLALYAFGMQQMEMRGHERANYHLREGES
ncbi:MAG: hypothetical protein WKF84_01820 [Pyrinomonadaceae bacterium]